MRYLILVACLMMGLHACGGDTSVALFIHWGDCDFDRERWSHADGRARGCMLASLFEKHPPESMTAAEVQVLLGEPTGYAGFDEFPAYLVEPAAGTSVPRGGQLLVFVTDRRSGRVVEAQLRQRP